MGALGKMGAETCRAVSSDGELDLVGAVDPAARGIEPPALVEGTDIEVLPDTGGLDPGGIDVVVDFTSAEAAIDNIRWALPRGIHCVVGTTGLSDNELGELERLSKEAGSNVIVAPNFAIGAVLMMKFSEQAARVFDQCEIVELHHRGKLDAPSGTAIATARRVGGVIDPTKLPPSIESEVTGARGGEAGPVRIHSVRLDGLVAHQEVIFGATGQTLTIRHDTTDRTCFMPGVIMAVKAVDRLIGLTVGLEPVLDL